MTHKLNFNGLHIIGEINMRRAGKNESANIKKFLNKKKEHDKGRNEERRKGREEEIRRQ